MKLSNIFSSIFLLLSFLSVHGAVTDSIPNPSNGFYAYHTDLLMSGLPADKYKDLVVVFGKGKLLEFSRKTGYLPVWITPAGKFSVNELFPKKDKDTHCDYTYVRLIKPGSDEIVVHWRYIPNIKRIIAANINLDPLNPYGIQGAVNEIFMIHSNGTMERQVKNGANTRAEDWNNPAIITRQQIKLTNTGIELGKVEWGKSKPIFPRDAIEGNPIKTTNEKNGLMLAWTFDEGLTGHNDKVRESVSGTTSEIEGGQSIYKKGVSGTALAFDGYYTGVRLVNSHLPRTLNDITAEAWVALDAFPYNVAPVIHQSTAFGKTGFFLGIDAYGYVIFRVNGEETKSTSKLKQASWTHIAGVYANGKMSVVVNGKVEDVVNTKLSQISLPNTDLFIGRNSTKEACTDYVRSLDENLKYISSIQGLLDEVKVYRTALTDKQLKSSYKAYVPADLASDLKLCVLPGEPGKAKSFGASYRSLKVSDIWDGLWRQSNYEDIVIKFDELPTSVIFWKGTNHAPNFITENNHWFADQSSETGGIHGCSEHMSDKQVRMCYANIVESSPARAVIHWRYPCIDVGYVCGALNNWTDEYFTIYPDGSTVRKVCWNGNMQKQPGFEDGQLLMDIGESPLNIVNLQAMTVANRKGETKDLIWSAPNNVPENTLRDASIELINTKSDYKVFLAFQGGYIGTWGHDEQSKYSDDPFAGPWNHWPMHLVPSDGRFIVANDRISHFALGGNDIAPKFGNIVLYGFTNQKIDSVIPILKSWQTPPPVVQIFGATSLGYNKDAKSFDFISKDENISFAIESSKENPVVNPCFIIKNWGSDKIAEVRINGKVIPDGTSLRQGVIRDVDGTKALVIWAEIKAEKAIQVTIK